MHKEVNKMKKLLALLLCICLLAAVGCGSADEALNEAAGSAAQELVAEASAEVPVEEEAVAEEATASDTAETNASESLVKPIGYGAGVALYPADTVVATFNGVDITWAEYYYWLYREYENMQYIYSYYSLGEMIDWSDTNLYYYYTTGGFYDNEYVISYSAMSDMLEVHSYMEAAKAAGLEITDEDLESRIEVMFDSNYGDGDGVLSDTERADVEAMIAESGVTWEDYSKIYYTYYMGEDFCNAVREEISEEDALAWANENGYMAAKHILLLTVDTSTGDALDDETVAAAEQTAADLYAELSAIEDTDELIARFDELMAEYSEDPGSTSYPEGYFFTSGEMVDEFETAVAALDEQYGLSEPVLSSYGWHVILRCPLNAEMINTSGYTAADLYASQVQVDRVTEATADMSFEWQNDFNNLDLSQVF